MSATVEQIKEAVCRYYELPAIEMVSHRRARRVARPRQIAMALAAELTPLSLPAVGKKFGGRDHTTVMHAIKQVRRLGKIDEAFAYDISLIREQLGKNQTPSMGALF